MCSFGIFANAGRRFSNSTQPDEGNQHIRQTWERIVTEEDISEILPTDDLTPARRRRFTATLSDAENLAKRRRICESNDSQVDINAILQADDDHDLIETATNPINYGVELTAPGTIPDSEPESTQVTKSQSNKQSKIPKKPFRDMLNELQMQTRFANLDVQSSLRQPNFIINIPKTQYNTWETSKISENSSNPFGMGRPIMAECLKYQYERNLKTTKKSQKLKEKTLNAMTVVEDFFNKKSIETENMSYDEIRNMSYDEITTIAELDASLEQSELPSQTSDAGTGATSSITMSR